MALRSLVMVGRAGEGRRADRLIVRKFEHRERREVRPISRPRAHGSVATDGAHAGISRQPCSFPATRAHSQRLVQGVCHQGTFDGGTRRSLNMSSTRSGCTPRMPEVL